MKVGFIVVFFIFKKEVFKIFDEGMVFFSVFLEVGEDIFFIRVIVFYRFLYKY